MTEDVTTPQPSRRWLLWPLLAALATRLACLPLAKVLPRWGDANGYLYLRSDKGNLVCLDMRPS